MRFLSAAVLALWFALGLSAAPPAPAVEVRLRGVTELLDRFEYLAKLVDQEDAGSQLVQTVQGFADPKTGLEGIDPGRPVGLYATVAPNPLESRVVLLLPIADETSFLGLLTGKLSLDPKKGDDGVYQVQVPGVPLPVYFRFAQKSCYVTVGLPAALDADQLLTPASFFADPDGSVLSARVRLDRMPKDLLESILTQAELRAADEARKSPATDPARRAGEEFGRRTVLTALMTGVREGQEFSARLTVDPKTDALTAELGLTPKSGSPLAGVAKAVAGRPVVAGSVRAPADAVGVVRVNARLDGGLKAAWVENVRKLYADGKAKAQAKGDFLPVYDQLWAAVEPTLVSGVFDFGVVGLPAGDTGLKVVAAAAVVDGKKVEAAVKQLAPFAPEKDAKFAFDKGTAGGLTLHAVTLGDKGFAAATGSDAVWLGTGDTRLVVGTDADGRLVKELADRRPAPAPLVEVRASLSRLLALGEDALPAATSKKLVGQVFGPAGPVGRDAIALTVAGGDALRVNLSLTGKALQLAVLADKERKKGKD